MARIALSSILLGMFGFSSCGDEIVSCDDDVLGCGPQDLAFELDPGCSEAEGATEIVVVAGEGDGEGGFRALDPDELPEIHYGSQGGMHMWTGIQIRNPNLERPLHRIEIELQSCASGLDCGLEESWQTDSESAVSDGPRTIVVDDQSLRETKAGWLELRDVLFLISFGFDDSPDSQVRLSVSVQDTCDRWGHAVYLDTRGN